MVTPITHSVWVDLYDMVQLRMCDLKGDIPPVQSLSPELIVKSLLAPAAPTSPHIDDQWVHSFSNDAADGNAAMHTNAVLPLP